MSKTRLARKQLEDAGAPVSRIPEPKLIGRVVSIDGAHAVISLSPGALSAAREDRPQIGAILSIDAGPSVVLGLVSAMSGPPAAASAANADGRSTGPGALVELELIGEFSKPTASAPGRFRRGVSFYPALNDGAHLATRDELAALFLSNSGATVRVGAIKQDASIPASVAVNNLFSRHCAILGTTGAGKSCAVTLMLNSVLKKYPHAHIVLLDVHNEYANCFGEKAIVFDSSNLTLPFWMLTFEEFSEILYPGRRNCEEEIEILLELIPAARRMNLGAPTKSGAGLTERRSDPSAVTVDTPTPYRVSDLLTLIDRSLGGLDHARATAPFKRLRARLKQISTDARYGFMFGGLTVQDTMSELLGQLFRIPVADAPVSVIELGGMPDEVAQVVVSVIARIAFEFGLWSHGAAPVALIVEDAHRFAAADSDSGFAPTRRALVRIAKEGRKTGVSLWVVSQRPTELDPTVLSQCNSIFAMRLANQADQDALRAAIPDAATSLLACLPSLGLGEAIAIGESVALPCRIRFDAVSRETTPRSLTSSFTEAWAISIEDEAFLERIVDQWRAQKILTALS
ncbi:MAG: DUF87 domain-containing protein [Alphaproteobacteria bacterium]|nr:DUF87 domain-containing protein [Alphaproteobacteria bacterium]